MKTQQEYEDFIEEFVKNSGGGNVLTADILKAWDEAQATQPTQPEKEELVEFNLEEALREPERVRFRNGETPLEWHYFSSYTLGSCPIVAIVNTTKIHTTKKGYQLNEKEETNYDLMLVKKKKLVWFGLYEVQSGEVITTPTFDMKEKVKDFIGSRKLLKLYSYEL